MARNGDDHDHSYAEVGREPLPGGRVKIYYECTHPGCNDGYNETAFE